MKRAIRIMILVGSEVINDVGVQGVVSSDGFGLVHGHPWAKIKKRGGFSP